MLLKRIALAAGLVLLILLVAATASAQRPVIAPENVSWELSNPQVINPGQTIVNEEGTLTTGFIIEAKARTRSGNLLPEGTFRLTLSAFSPARDMPGQKAGLWYVRGDWTVTKKNADPIALKFRHNPNVAGGKMNTVLTFNPATTRSNWSAKATLPMSLAAGQWARGDGVLSLNAQLEGNLFLSLKLWSAIR